MKNWENFRLYKIRPRINKKTDFIPGNFLNPVDKRFTPEIT